MTAKKLVKKAKSSFVDAIPITSEPVTADESPSDNLFPIVGLGASAGGLRAFEAFFSGMPANVKLEMAFVLVQHLAPDHESILTDLIRRYTTMQVFEVTDGMVVQINCAYIIPPNYDLAYLKGRLHLLEPSAPRGQRLPIDFFFRSLAQDQREHAIGIILSGLMRFSILKNLPTRSPKVVCNWLKNVQSSNARSASMLAFSPVHTNEKPASPFGNKAIDPLGVKRS